MIQIQIPEKAKYIIETIQNAGFEAYVVGGCVRDSILGRCPEDWDITTSARPEQVKALFRRTIDTGIQHGTVTVLNGKEGFEVTLLPVGTLGTVTAQQVADTIRDDTCLVSVMYANNEIGSVMPIAEIGKVCRERGVLFHTDAVQAAGHLPINVKEQNIDMLSLSAHKFHGPKGTGVLYARTGVVLSKIGRAHV